MDILQRARDGFARVLRFATQSLNVLYAELAIIVIAVILAPTVWALGYPVAARQVCFIAAILLSAYAHIFDARLLLGATGYKWLRRLIRIVAKKPDDSQPDLSELFYWTSFVQMWAPWVLVLMGFIAPWEDGWYLLFLALITLVLWGVSTQRHFGNLWRRIHITSTVTMLVFTLFGVYFSGWLVRIQGEHHRSQQVSQIEESNQKRIASKLLAQIDTINIELADLNYSISQDEIAGRPVPQWRKDKVRNLKRGKSRAENQLDTFGKLRDTGTVNRKQRYDVGLLVLAAVLAMVVLGKR